jgi:hypothetical protein
MPLCNGHRTDGQPCGKFAMKNKTKCMKHGGKSLVGRAAPNYKHGGYSKYDKVLPQRMLAAYREASQDGRMLQLREEVALLDARLADLLTRVDSGESGRLWARLGTAHAEFVQARTLGKVEIMQEKLAEIGGLIAEGKSDAECWREIHATLDLRRKLVESERKRLLDAQQAVTAEQLTGFMSALLDLLTREVTDRKLLSRLSDGLYQLAAVDVTPSSAVSTPA